MTETTIRNLSSTGKTGGRANASSLHEEPDTNLPARIRDAGHDDPARVKVELDKVGTSSLRTRERIVAGSDGRVALEAVCVSVHLDATKLRSAPLPEALRARLG